MWFTTSLFTEEVRRVSGAWRVLDYVPYLNRERSGATNQLANSTSDKGKVLKRRYFHKVMDAMMKGMVEAQAGKDCWLKKVPLKLCGQRIVVGIVCPLLFVINDGKQGDQLCGHMNCHHHHATVSLTILTIQMLSALFLLMWTQSTTSVAPVLMMTFRESQCTRLMMPSTMGQKAHGIFMCTVVDGILYDMVSSCIASNHSRKGLATNHWQSLTEWHHLP